MASMASVVCGRIQVTGQHIYQGDNFSPRLGQTRQEKIPDRTV
jgi:hypothetical protein